MRTVVALRPIRYASKSYKKGDEFSMMSRHADIFGKIGRVKDAPQKAAAAVAAEPAVPAGYYEADTPSVVDVPKPKRKYTRRVKVAADSEDDAPAYYGRRDMTAGDH